MLAMAKAFLPAVFDASLTKWIISPRWETVAGSVACSFRGGDFLRLDDSQTTIPLCGSVLFKTSIVRGRNGSNRLSLIGLVEFPDGNPTFSPRNWRLFHILDGRTKRIPCGPFPQDSRTFFASKEPTAFRYELSDLRLSLAILRGETGIESLFPAWESRKPQPFRKTLVTILITSISVAPNGIGWGLCQSSGFIRRKVWETGRVSTARIIFGPHFGLDASDRPDHHGFGPM